MFFFFFFFDFCSRTDKILGFGFRFNVSPCLNHLENLDTWSLVHATAVSYLVSKLELCIPSCIVILVFSFLSCFANWRITASYLFPVVLDNSWLQGFGR